MVKKHFYKIGEACRLLDIQPYVLRYWETEFPLLKPSKSRSGQRVYSEAELAIIRRIKQLLYEEGYTIAGAKKRLEAVSPEELAGELPAGESEAAPSGAEQSRASLDTDLSERIKLLRQGVQAAAAEARQLLELLAAPKGRS